MPDHHQHQRRRVDIISIVPVDVHLEKGVCRDHNYVICGCGRWKSNHVAWNHVVGNIEMGEETLVLRLIGQTEARS